MNFRSQLSRYTLWLLCSLCALAGASAHATLQISAGIDRETQTAGTSALISVLITNNGSSAETGLEVSTTIPTGLAGVAESLVEGPLNAAASCATASGSTATCDANEQLIFSIGAIAPGQAIPLSFPLTISGSPAASTAYDFEFTLTQSAATVDSSTVSLLSADAPALDISLAADNNPAAVGDQIRYTLSYGNISAASVTNASLVITLPAELSFESATGNGVNSANQVTWNLGSLPAGVVAEQEVLVTVTTAANGTPLPIRAEVNGLASALPTERAVSAQSYIGEGSPLELSLALNRESIAPNNQVLVDMTVANASSGTVFGGRVTLRLPRNVAGVAESLTDGPVDAAASCANASGSTSSCTSNEFLVFDLGNLAAGEAKSLSFPATTFGTATNPAGSNIAWSATVSDDSGVLETEAVSLLTDSSANLNLAVSTSVFPAAAGQAVIYTLHYGNANSESVSTSSLVMRLPEGSTASTISDGGTSDGSSITWDLASLPAGSVGQRQVTVAMPAGATAGSLQETDVTLSGLLSSLPSERRTTQTTLIGSGTALELALSVNPSPLEAGERALVDLLVSNPSSATVFGGVVRLRAPANLNGVAESLVAGPLDADASCATDSGSNSSCTANEYFEFALNAVAPGQAFELSFPVTVFGSATSGDLLDFRAFVGDDNGGLESRDQVIAIVDTTDLHLAIDDDIDPVAPGLAVTYVVSYGNASGTSLAGGVLSLDLPTNLNFVSASGGGQLNGSQVQWNLGSLLDETIARQTVVVTSSAAAAEGDVLRVAATLAGTVNSLPVVTRSRESGHVGAGSELAVELSVTPDPALAGTELSVDVTVNNPTTELIPGARVTLRTPQNLSGISESLVEGPLDADASCANDSGSSSSCTAGELFEWDLGNVAPGETTELRVPATILGSLANGNQIEWQVTAVDDTTALTTESQTIQIGEVAQAGPIGASLLPVSRSVQVGQTATAFASIVNSSTNPAFDCSIAPATSIAATFSYQATDAATNGAIGSPDTPVEIAGGASQSFIFAFTPTAAFAPTEIALTFDCSNTDPAAVFVGVNTLLLSAEDSPIPDIIGLTTTTDLQVITGATTLFAVGSANVGSSGNVTVSLDDAGVNLPVTLQLCQTDPATGACSGPIGPTTTLNYGAGTTASFAIFVDASGSIDFSPAANRIFIRFTDDGGVVRGATSTSVRSQ